MKQFYTLFIAIAFLPSFIHAQCTINPSAQTTPGVSPAAIDLPCIERTVFYDQTLQGKIESARDTSIFGIAVHTQVDSFRLDSIVGLPSGITWSKSPNVLLGGGNGCVRLYGTTTAPPGRYQIQGWGTAWVHVTAPSMGMDTLTTTSGNMNPYSPFGNYYVEVINAGAPCRPPFSVSLGPDRTVCLNYDVTVNPNITSGEYPYTYQWASSGSQSCCNGFSTWHAVMAMNSTVSVTVTDDLGNTVTDQVVITVSPPSHTSFDIVPSGPLTFCTGSVTLDAGAGFATYQWSNFTFNRSIGVTQSGVYHVTATEANGCSYTDAVSVSANTSFSGQQVCAVTVDEVSGKNVVVWEKFNTYGVTSFKVYKETSVTGVYQLMTDQAFGSFSTYEDALSNPAQQSERYVVTTVDPCGESAYSGSHKTIHLTSNIGINNVVNLAWNAYEGFTYPSFNIYRGSSQANMTQLAQVSSSTFSYTDLNPPVSPVFYQIEVINPQGCTPTAKTESYSSSRSNVILINSLGINAADKDDFKIISAFDDNTGKNMLKFNSTAEKNMNLKMFDYSGREVYRTDNINQSEIALPDFISRGIYIAEVAREQKNYRVKILVR